MSMQRVCQLITSHLVAVNQRLMSPSLGDLAEWLCKTFWQPITNDLAGAVCQPSQMASSFISGMASSFTSQMAITNHLATVFWLPSGMASCFTSRFISSYACLSYTHLGAHETRN